MMLGSMTNYFKIEFLSICFDFEGKNKSSSWNEIKIYEIKSRKISRNFQKKVSN